MGLLQDEPMSPNEGSALRAVIRAAEVSFSAFMFSREAYVSIEAFVISRGDDAESRQ